jgi:GNAT superfamily N-acetyltransferase
MEVKIASSEAELRKISSVLLQLRSQYDEDSLIDQIRLQQAEGYQIAYVEKGGEVLCVAGFVICTKLAWQKHIYVDDLVTGAAVRSTGAGKFLMDWLKNHAREHGCQQLHLDSGVQRFAAHKFYLREGFELNSHHFGIPDLNAH